MPVFSIRGTFSIRRKGLYALQQRMLNMENAMMRIMHHLESQANAVQVPEATFSDQD